MTFAKNRAELIEGVRATVGYAPFDGELAIHGRGEIDGLAARFTRICDAAGTVVVTVESALGSAAGFDGAEGWRVDESGLVGALDLVDLEELIVASAVWSGAWLADEPPVEIAPKVEGDGARPVAIVRAPRGAHTFRLTFDGATRLPRTLERVGRPEAVMMFADFRPGGFGAIAHAVAIKQAWLEDRMIVEKIDRVAQRGERRAPDVASVVHRDTTRSGGDAAFDRPAPDVRFDDSATLDMRRTRTQIPLVRASVADVRSARAPRDRRPAVGGASSERDLGWFLLDTGAGACAIDERLAATFELAALGRRFVRTADGGIGAAVRRASALRIGPMSIAEPLFVELDLAPFAKAAGVPIAGVLGYDVFARCIVTLSRRVIELAPEPPAITSWWPLRFEGGRPAVPLRYPGSGEDDAIGLFVIDTASAAAVTFTAATAETALLRGGGRSTLRGITGTIGGRAHVLPWVELAGVRVETVDALVTTDERGTSRSGGVLGTLGMGLLRDFDLVFDYARRRVAIQRRPRTR